MLPIEYIISCENKRAEQNNRFDPDGNWSFDGTKTSSRKELEKHDQCWLDIASRRKHSDKMTLAFYILVWNNDNKEWLEQCIKSCLWQVSDFEYNLHLVLVVDPPYEKTKIILDEFRYKYSGLAEFHIRYNSIRKYWSGSYNIALDICKDIKADYAFVQDSDDLSHPLRILCSINEFRKYREYNLRCVSAVPMHLQGDEKWFDCKTPDCWHPVNFHDCILPFVEACIIQHPNEGHFFNYNPNTICINKDVIDNIRIRKEIVDDSKNILFCDSAFIMEIMKAYPFGLMETGVIGYFNRIYKGSFTKSAKTDEKIKASYEWRNRIANETRNNVLANYPNCIEILQEYLETKYHLLIDDQYFETQD